MYSREIQDKRYSPIEKGMPIQGTWTRPFDEVDLLAIHRPYRLPLPRGIRDYRIKEWESFFIQNDEVILMARLCNMKLYRTALVTVYDKKNDETLEFKKVIPGGAWRLPRHLNNASIDSRSYGFFFRIHTWLDAGTVSLELDIEPTKKRKPLTAYATFDLAAKKTTPMAVNLLFSERRNMYAYKAMSAVSGDLVFGGRHLHFDPENSSGLFIDSKGFYPFRSRSVWGTGTGFDSQNRRFGFSVSEGNTREPYGNNENALWLNGTLTPLPPVKITQSSAVEGEWIIQDMEGMVDLVFSPRDEDKAPLIPLYTPSEYTVSIGSYNGLILSADGEEIPLRNVWGCGEKFYLKV